MARQTEGREVRVIKYLEKKKLTFNLNEPSIHRSFIHYYVKELIKSDEPSAIY